MMKGKFLLLRNFHKGLIIKGVVVLVAAVTAVLSFYVDKGLVEDNRKMIKYIKNQEAFQQDLELLKENENHFRKAVLTLEPNASDAELEKIKSGYIVDLLEMIQKDKLQVDSYRSEIEKSEGFVVFKYDITIVGDFIQVLRFFYRLREDVKHILVSRYDIRMHVNTLVRMGLTVEIVGMEGVVK